MSDQDTDEGGGRDSRPPINGSRESSRLLTAREVAEILGVRAAWVYEQSRRGRIPTVTLGRYRRYRLESVLAWVERLEREGAGPARQGARKASRAA